MSAGTVVSIENRELTLTNLDKVLYPADGFTKAQVIDYYARIAPVMLPHIAGRAMTLRRFPNGVGGNSFFEKNCPSHRPPWVPVAPVHSGGKDEVVDYCLVNETATLAWLANLAALELHASLAMGADPETPTEVVFDLDPGAPAAFVQCCEIALVLREVLEAAGLQAWPKSSGSKGLQVYVPLNTPHDYTQTSAFAHKVAQEIEERMPKRVTSNMRKDLRTGKIFIDWSQNSRHKTTAAVYSLRAVQRPMASAPLTWDEVAAVAAKRDASLGMFDSSQVLARVEKLGDLFAPVATTRQELPGGNLG